MSIFGKTAAPASPPTPSLAEKLAEARTRHLSLVSQLGPLVLAVETGDEQQAPNLALTRQAIRDAEQRIADLTAALAVQEKQDHAAQAESLGKLREAGLRTMKKRLAERDAAASRYAEAIGAANAAYRDMLAAASAARLALPVGLEMPKEALLDDASLYEAARNELWRVGGYTVGDPVARVLMPGLVVQPMRAPNEIPPLTEFLGAVTKRVAGVLQGQIDSARCAAAGEQREPLGSLVTAGGRR